MRVHPKDLKGSSWRQIENIIQVCFQLWKKTPWKQLHLDATSRSHILCFCGPQVLIYMFTKIMTCLLTWHSGVSPRKRSTTSGCLCRSKQWLVVHSRDKVYKVLSSMSGTKLALIHGSFHDHHPEQGNDSLCDVPKHLERKTLRCFCLLNEKQLSSLFVLIFSIIIIFIHSEAKQTSK